MMLFLETAHIYTKSLNKQYLGNDNMTHYIQKIAFVAAKHDIACSFPPFC